MQNPLKFAHADNYGLLVWMCVNRCVLPGDCQLGRNSGRLVSMRCLSLLTDLASPWVQMHLLCLSSPSEPRYTRSICSPASQE